MPRSISPASPKPNGATATPSEGATVWIAAELAGFGAAHITKTKHRRSRHARRNLFEQLRPFAAHAIFELSKSGRIAARPGKAIDEAGGMGGGTIGG